MNIATRQFLDLVLEKKEAEKEASKKSGKKKPKPEPAEEKTQKTATKNLQVFRTAVSNKLALGKPISDPGLANMKYRANGKPAEATQMMSDLDIDNPGSGEWYERLNSIFNSSTSGDMGALINGSELVKSVGDKVGVKLSLKGVWKQDDKDGKRSFGFIRALIMGAKNAGYLNLNKGQMKKLRVEQAMGSDVFIVYVGNAKSWDQ